MSCCRSVWGGAKAWGTDRRGYRPARASSAFSSTDRPRGALICCRSSLKDFGGSVCEPAEAGPFFFELITRKGDQGFGAGNFRALFESIEREQTAEPSAEGSAASATPNGVGTATEEPAC